MKENEIGACKCPVCGSAHAKLRVSKSQLAYIHCGGCQVQIMARGDRADELMRGMVVGAAPAAPAAPEAPAAPAAPAREFSWGVLGVSS